MVINSLYIKLKSAYTELNLNNISAKIIDLYKDKQYGTIRKIAKIFDESENLDEDQEEKIGKSFSKLIRLYHPDKLRHYQNEIEKYHKAQQLDKLNELAHIFLILDIDNIIASFSSLKSDSGFTAEYIWDNEEDEIKNYSDDSEFDKSGDETWTDEFDNSFFSGIKRKFYGNLNIELPFLLLEDLENVEMTDFEIDTLDGIEFCKNLVQLDLSHNNLTDISEIRDVKRIEELYLSNNHIGYIDAISNLIHLKIADLSNNEIDDLSPLFQLEKLEYLNIVGNKIPVNQIKYLMSKEITVIY